MTQSQPPVLWRMHSPTNSSTSPSSDVPLTHGLALSIGRNTLFGFAFTLVQLAARFATVPVMIKHLGMEGYGVWSVLMSVAAYMSLGGAGIRSAFQKYAAEATATRDFDQASKLITTGTVMVTVLSVVTLLPLAIVSDRLAALAHVPPRLLPDTVRAIRILALASVFMNLGQSYRAIIMGAHRIDLQKILGSVSMAVQVGAVVVVLRLGCGLVALTVVFCAVELGDLCGCYMLSRRALPSLRLGVAHLSAASLASVVRFTGSYQLVSILESVYAAILPIAVLSAYGAAAAGVLALANRLVAAALLAQGDLLQPILSAGTFALAAGHSEAMSLVLKKSIRVTVALSVLPLAFVAVFGGVAVFAWTGESPALLPKVLWLLCITGLLRALSALTRVLYRVSGGSLADNGQLLIMLAILLVTCIAGKTFGVLGLVAGAALAQAAGLAVMWSTISARFPVLSPAMLGMPILRAVGSAAAVLAPAVLSVHFRVTLLGSARAQAAYQVAIASIIVMVLAPPVMLLCGLISWSDLRVPLDLLRGRAGAAVRKD